MEARTTTMEETTAEEALTNSGEATPSPKQSIQENPKVSPTADSTLGRNVSGRDWKNRSQKRASSLINTKKNNQSKPWQKRQEEKRLRQEAMALQKEMKEEKRQEAIAKKERRLENERRRAENEYKNVQKSVQTLNYNTANLKLKSMSKKQLRQIKKTRMNTKTGVVELVSPYAK